MTEGTSLTTVVGLAAIGFNSRIALGGCVINIGGETLDCAVTVDKSNTVAPTYIVKDKETGRELCTFNPWHVTTMGSTMFCLEMAHQGRADATLIVPPLGQEDEAAQRFYADL